METELRPAQRDYANKCIRACRGLPDPEAAIAGLVEAAEGVREAALAWADSTPSDRRISEIQMALSADKLGVAVASFLAARKDRDRG